MCSNHELVFLSLKVRSECMAKCHLLYTNQKLTLKKIQITKMLYLHIFVNSDSIMRQIHEDMQPSPPPTVRISISIMDKNCTLIITSERNERSSYQQSYMGHLGDIQTALKPLKKGKKLKYIFITVLGLVETRLLNSSKSLSWLNQYIFQIFLLIILNRQ